MCEKDSGQTTGWNLRFEAANQFVGGIPVSQKLTYYGNTISDTNYYRK